MFAHSLLLPMLGIPLGEMFDLSKLAADCAEDGRTRACSSRHHSTCPTAWRRHPTRWRSSSRWRRDQEAGRTVTGMSI